ncbi:MAG: FRG domain-containing protein [Desulfobaccales bacterium]
MKHDDENNMSRTDKTGPFPHTEVETTRPDVDVDKLSDDLLNWLAWEFVEPEKWGWIFRGHRKHYYSLKSSLHRKLESREKCGTAHSCSKIDHQTAENYLLSQFRKAAHHYIEASMVPDKNDDRLEWLALMQHYGAPTRLLDFTHSSYIACFFALEEAEREEKAAIWAIDTSWLVEKSFPRLKGDFPIRSEDDLMDSNFMAKHFDEIFVSQKSLLLPIVPPRSNPRLLVQQGIFLCPGIGEDGIEKSLASYKNDTNDMNEHVLKIIIEKRIRTEVLFELRLMNISRASLFPDLQGYASSLAHELEYKSSDEIKRSSPST